MHLNRDFVETLTERIPRKRHCGDDCDVNYPYPLLLNHSDVWYVVCEVLVRLYLEVPENLNVLFL